MCCFSRYQDFSEIKIFDYRNCICTASMEETVKGHLSKGWKILNVGQHNECAMPTIVMALPKE